jgi:virginiamycin B lyase
LKSTRLLFAVIGIVLIGGAFVWGIMSVANGSPPSPIQNSCGPAVLTDTLAGYVAEYRTPGNCSSPNGITVDALGRVWFVEQNTSNLAVFYPASGNFTEYGLPVNEPITWSLTSTADGKIWMTDANSSEIIRFDPGSSNFTQYRLNPDSFPMQVVRGPDGAVWFSELYGHRIGRIQPGNGLLTEYPTPSNDTAPSGIAFDLNGTLWISMVSFNESVPNTLATLDPGSGVYHYYEMPTPIAQPTGIAVDRSGKVWFAEHGSSFLGRFDPATGQLIEIATSRKLGAATTLPYWLVEDAAGNIWFNEHYANRIARLNPGKLTLTEYDIPSRVPSYGNISNALTVATGPNGDLWFTELTASRLGLVNASVVPDISVAGPASVDVSSDSTLRFNLTATGTYAGGFGLEASDSEVASGALQNFTVSFSSTVSLLYGKPFVVDINATVTLIGGPILGDYYFTFTAREPNLAASKIVIVRLVPPP